MVATATRRLVPRRELRESAALSGRVDRDKGIIYGVKVVGRHSPNTHGVQGVEGTDYTLAALKDALPMYEGICVNVDHPTRGGPPKDRSARDRFAWVEEAKVTDDGIFGDLHFLDPNDPLAVKMMNAADEKPDAFALSHNAWGKGEIQDKRYVITAIPEVRSVDIVADGGTNRSLFESHGAKTMTTLRAILEAAPKKKYRRLRKLMEMYEDAGDMEMEAPEQPADNGAAGGLDEEDHLFQAFKKLKAEDPERANKILAMLKAEVEGGGEGEGAQLDEDDEGAEGEGGEVGAGEGKVKEGEECDDKKDKVMKESKERVRVCCKLAGIEATTELVESLAPLRTTKAIAAILTQLRSSSKTSAPRSAAAGSVQIRESRQGNKVMPKTAEEQAVLLLRG